MVNIDDVYQKVLILADKEKGGYITPQEFNLLANKAQLDIVNNYFHEIKTSNLKPTNSSDIGDLMGMIREKMNYIKNFSSQTATPQNDGLRSRINFTTTGIYMLASVKTATTDSEDWAPPAGNAPTTWEFNSTATGATFLPGVEVVEADDSELQYILNNQLTRPTTRRPIYVRASNWLSDDGDVQYIDLDIYPATITSVVVEYFEKPQEVVWGYVVVNNKALYNFNESTHFQLHPAEEEPLVMRILQLAGISTKKPDLQQSVMVDQQATKQNQNT